MKNQRAERLRTTVDFLPPETKRAMLDGLERNRIITGANTDRRGGMCPMIAADRDAFKSGPMADIFAAVWDSYNGACILNRRDATERDLRTLKTMLETSLANSPELSSELGQAWLDYHVGSEPGSGAVEVDFDQALTTALEQSALLDTGSFDPVSTSPSQAPGAEARERKISLIYDGDPLPAPAARPVPAATATERAGRGERRSGTTLETTYEPYTVAAPKRRAPLTRAGVDQPGRLTAARHAARTADSTERARARAIIANQAATLRGRAWPRSADAQPVAVEVPAPAPVRAATPLEAPAIRQAAIPQSRRASAQETAPAAPRRGRPTGIDDRTTELEGRSGWSWLPPFRSYDDYEEALENAGQLEPGPRAVPEVQPPEENRRPVRL